MNGRPTKAEIAAAVNRTVPDILASDLSVVFCGINPGLYTAAVGHHFARPGNRFWPALHLGGFTPHQLAPSQELELLEFGYGITNIVRRATATAAELSKAELIKGGEQLTLKLQRYRPRWMAVLGIEAYRHAFDRKEARVGRQPEPIADTDVWLLPSPSGLNAHYTLEKLGEAFAEFRAEAGVEP